LVNADLTDQASITAAVQDATMIIHTASPFALKDSTDEQDYIKPAVEGTMAVMNAAAGCPSVKRVVLTSSVVTLVDCGKEKPAHYDPNDWSISEK
jgi:dihydroflavonol-4-reductase